MVGTQERADKMIDNFKVSQYNPETELIRRCYKERDHEAYLSAKCTRS